MRLHRRSGTPGAAGPDRGREWPWPARDTLRADRVRLLDDTKEDHHRRLIWAGELLARSFRVLDKRDQAATDTGTSHWIQRTSAGASAVVATLTGGTLTGSIHGRAAAVTGIGAAIAGLAAAGVAAAKPEQSYAADLAQKCLCEQLRRDMRSYAVTQLPAADENGLAAAVNGFAGREAGTMGSAAPATPS
jgi:hypothetical protein